LFLTSVNDDIERHAIYQNVLFFVRSKAFTRWRLQSFVALQRYMLSLNDLVNTFSFVGERHMKEDVIFNKVSLELLGEVLYMILASRKKNANM